MLTIQTEDLAETFDIAAHYNAMAQLDADVHRNDALSKTEAELALRLVCEAIGRTPETVFLPCFGTGRHIPFLLQNGVEKIVGVDLSPKCVEKARALFGHDPRVELELGDLLQWRASSGFDAAILLGNSFADCVDPELLLQLTSAMIAPLKDDGAFVMDYIGTGYLQRCREGAVSCWDAVMDGIAVKDRRTPRYNSETRVMSIDVSATATANPRHEVWRGSYHKLILDNAALRRHFLGAAMRLKLAGKATDLNPYYLGQSGDLGMIAASQWWIGQKDNGKIFAT